MRQALELALEALEEFGEHYNWCHQFPTYASPEEYPPCNCGYDKAITAIKEALAQPEHTWISLTDEERKDLCRSWPSPMDAIYATESKLKDKNK
jgi:hypothetical protein